MYTSQNNKKKGFLLIATALLLIAISISGYVLLQKNNQSPENASAGTKGPITGTFLLFDYNQQHAASSIAEMKDFGIDTVVIQGTSSISYTNNAKSGCSISNVKSVTPEKEPHYIEFINQLKKANMHLYLGIVVVDPSCYDMYATANRSMMINTSIQGFEATKKLINDNAWWDKYVDGIYISNEINLENDANAYALLPYYTDVSKAFKSKYPAKKILTSPYIWENSGSQQQIYNRFLAYYKTHVDIIALQDSVGAGKTTTMAKSRMNFQALKDAANKTGKTAWANIETFRMDKSPGGYKPASFDQIKAQIDATDGLVSKKITWIYQHDFLSISGLLNETWSWSKQYTLSNAILRRKLKTAYENYYINGIDNAALFEWKTELIYKANNLCSLGTHVDGVVEYIDKAKNYKKYSFKNLQIRVVGDMQEVGIPLSQLPKFVSATQGAMRVTPSKANATSSCKVINRGSISFVFPYGTNLVVKGSNFNVGKPSTLVIKKNGVIIFQRERFAVKEGSSDVIYIGNTLLQGIDLNAIKPSDVTVTY